MRLASRNNISSLSSWLEFSVVSCQTMIAFQLVIPSNYLRRTNSITPWKLYIVQNTSEMHPIYLLIACILASHWTWNGSQHLGPYFECPEWLGPKILKETSTLPICDVREWHMMHPLHIPYHPQTGIILSGSMRHWEHTTKCFLTVRLLSVHPVLHKVTYSSSD